MKMDCKWILLPMAWCLLFINSQAQSSERFKIALFTPLYLDSAFDYNGNYTLGKTFPKFLNGGLEFYLGAQAALDSLEKRGAPMEVFVYDSRSRFNSISSIIKSPDFSKIEMIVAQSTLTETKVLAEEAQRKKIPFISATLPNDAGVYNNPYFVILNSSLQSHVEGMYKMLQKFYSLEKIIVFRKPGTQEDLIKKYLTDYGKITPAVPLNLKFVDVGNNFTPQTLAAHLDSNKKNICVAGALDESFGVKLAQTLAGLNKTYPISLIGMPTWESFNFGKTTTSLEIIYSSPFYFNRSSILERKLADEFTAKMNGRPTDLYFRGYETVLRFGLLLLDSKKDVASNLSKKGNYVFTQYDIQPVFRDKRNMTLDYFENKHLYFIRILNNSKSLFSW